ncbi:hypothetical protein GGQ84_001887 [Desulfitispora alkaliphila]
MNIWGIVFLTTLTTSIISILFTLALFEGRGEL